MLIRMVSFLRTIPSSVFCWLVVWLVVVLLLVVVVVVIEVVVVVSSSSQRSTRDDAGEAGEVRRVY